MITFEAEGSCGPPNFEAIFVQKFVFSHLFESDNSFCPASSSLALHTSLERVELSPTAHISVCTRVCTGS